MKSVESPPPKPARPSSIVGKKLDNDDDDEVAPELPRRRYQSSSPSVPPALPRRRNTEDTPPPMPARRSNGGKEPPKKPAKPTRPISSGQTTSSTGDSGETTAGEFTVDLVKPVAAKDSLDIKPSASPKPLQSTTKPYGSDIILATSTGFTNEKTYRSFSDVERSIKAQNDNSPENKATDQTKPMKPMKPMKPLKPKALNSDGASLNTDDSMGGQPEYESTGESPKAETIKPIKPMKPMKPIKPVKPVQPIKPDIKDNGNTSELADGITPKSKPVIQPKPVQPKPSAQPKPPSYDDYKLNDNQPLIDQMNKMNKVKPDKRNKPAKPAKPTKPSFETLMDKSPTSQITTQNTPTSLQAHPENPPVDFRAQLSSIIKAGTSPSLSLNEPPNPKPLNRSLTDPTSRGAGAGARTVNHSLSPHTKRHDTVASGKLAHPNKSRAKGPKRKLPKNLSKSTGPLTDSLPNSPNPIKIDKKTPPPVNKASKPKTN